MYRLSHNVVPITYTLSIEKYYTLFGQLFWFHIFGLFNDAFGIGTITPDDRMIKGCGVFGGMRIGRRNRSARRKATTKPLCPPQILQNPTMD
jgi:hypothetical protein